VEIGAKFDPGSWIPAKSWHQHSTLAGASWGASMSLAGASRRKARHIW